MNTGSQRQAAALLGALLAAAAAASAQDPVRYRLLEGTRLVAGSDPVIEVPLRGTLDLVPTSLPAEFLVRNFRARDPTGQMAVAGSGTYVFGDASHRMVLDLVSGSKPLHLDSGWVIMEAQPPMLGIDLYQDPPTPNNIGLHLQSVPALGVWFSTEVPFTRPDLRQVSAGDVLTHFGRVLWTNHELTRRLYIDPPPVPDIGLDALCPAEIDGPRWWEAWFSGEIDVFSATLGPLQDGDFLSERGFIAATNAELLTAFIPQSTEDFGLDAITWGWWCNGWHFSTEADFWSEHLLETVGHGDVLCARHGSIVYRNSELLARFDPLTPVARDLGLDALYLWPNGQVWFSVEEGFLDARYGWISDGDLLSTDGWVIYRNLELVARFAPLEDLANFGLDALHLAPVQRGDLNGDGFIDFGDIDFFVLALAARERYYLLFPELDPDVVGDCNDDGQMDFADIDPFVALLGGR